jgi:heterodisulfide reductase subunit A
VYTLSDVLHLQGELGRFTVTVRQRARYIDMGKCIACGTCAEKCPRKVDDAFNLGLSKRKAVYIHFSQAVPLKYAIDRDHCIYFEKGKCRVCEKSCPTQAVNWNDTDREFPLEVGAVVLAPGFEPCDPTRFETYGYGRFPDVLTSMEFERLLSAAGPTQGRLARPSDGKAPRKIAWLQCVGSRDIHHAGHAYCSAVCCMAAVKEAVIAKEHADGNLEAAIFFMDMRTHGKDFERYAERARAERGVRFIRSRVHSVEAASSGDGGLVIVTATESGEVLSEAFDLVVLSVGLETPEGVVQATARLGIPLNEHGFAQGGFSEPVATGREGVFACGAFLGPKDIPQSVMEASAAAAPQNRSSRTTPRSEWLKSVQRSVSCGIFANSSWRIDS